MGMTQAQRERIELAVHAMGEKVKAVHAAHPEIKLGETAAYRASGKVDDDPLRGPVNMEWAALIEPEKGALKAALDDVLASLPKVDCSGFPKLGADNLWVWGGQTPYWGGSMADDTLIRGAAYFDAQNVVYVYGPTNEKMMSLHSGFTRMLCQVNGNCRTPGAQEGGDDEDNAERLSRLSLDYPNIMGAMCDDVTTKFKDVIEPEQFKVRYEALKRHNDTLRMYGVVYVHELAAKDFSLIQPYLDTVNLWFWHMEEIVEYDRYLQLCQEKFPGKPVLQGIFLHEYGRTDSGNLPELLVYQLDKAREYMSKGIVEGVVLLGDREILKWPESSRAVLDYLRHQ